MSNCRAHKPPVSGQVGSAGSFHRGHGESGSACKAGILDVGREERPGWWNQREKNAGLFGWEEARCCAETTLTSEAGRPEWLIFYRDEMKT